MDEYDKAQLIQDLAAWADDEEVLARARKFLERDITATLWGRKKTYKTRGLGEMRVVNWKKEGRGIPEGVVEGAALYHCGRPSWVDAVSRTKLISEEFWQVFVVAAEGNKKRQHDCMLYRLWSDVRSTSPPHDEAYLTHKTWFTGTPGNEPDILGLPTCQRLREEREWHRIGKGNELAVALRVDRNQAADYGYRVLLRDTVEGDSKVTPYEYLGGLSGVPTQRLFMVALIPYEILRRSTGLLLDSRYTKPQCLEFLADGIPTQVIEHFLDSQKLTPDRQNAARRWLSPWFNGRGDARLVKPTELLLPPAIKAALERDGLSLDNPDSALFAVEIEAPAPYLYYSLVFELP